MGRLKTNILAFGMLGGVLGFAPTSAFAQAAPTPPPPAPVPTPAPQTPPPATPAPATPPPAPVPPPNPNAPIGLQPLPTAPTLTTPTAMSPTANTVNGIPSVDVIPLHAFVGGTPLRYGNVVAGSERVELNDRVLVSGDDYAMDDVAGVVYLKCPIHLGDTLVVNYRYDSKPAGPATSAPGAGWGGLDFHLMPGANFLMGLGLTERQSNGSVTTSNVYGWHNSFNLNSKSSLSGMYVMANQQGSTQGNAFSFGSPSAGQSVAGPGSGFASSQSSKSQFLLQSFKTGMMGGNVSVDYQKVGREFSSFDTIRAAGYAENDVKQFQAEKGLTRSGLSFTGLKFGNATISDSIKDVQDENGQGIQWRNLGVQQGGLKLNVTSQSIGQTFMRYSDLGESNKDQLAKERGMSRNSFTGEFQNKVGKLSIAMNDVSDNMYRSNIHQQKLSYNSTKYQLDYGRDDVDSDFYRTGNLTAPESAQWGREVGIKRQWLSFNASLNSKLKPLAFHETEMKGPTGKFSEMDAAFTGKSWSIAHIGVTNTAGFASVGAQPDDAINTQLQTINTMYNPAATGPNAADKPAFTTTAVGRNYTSIGGEFFKKWQARFDDLSLQGAKSNGSAVDMSLTGPALSASFKNEYAGSNLTELTGLTPTEQARWGTLPGLRRADFNLAMQLNKVTKLTVADMVADTAAGGAHRTTFDYATKGFEVSGWNRQVDTGFTSVGSLADPEAGLLASFIGFQQNDYKMAWSTLPHMKLTGEAQEARDEATGEVRTARNIAFNWDLDKKTQLAVTDIENGDVSPLQTTFLTESRQLSLTHDFGRFGKVVFMDDDEVSHGINATVPDSHSDYTSYETKLSQNTSIKAEETVTNYANGAHENISAETLSTQITKRAGVSVTQVQVAGDMPHADPGNTKFGGWYDLGSGVRIAYGYAHTFADGAATANSNVSIGKNTAAPTPDQYSTLQPGVIGPISMAGGYGTNQFEGGANPSHTQAFSNLNLSTVKPIVFGPISNIKFNIGMNSASDYAAWSKESDSGSFSGMLAKNAFGFNYNAQLAPTGGLGIDRAFSLQTSQSDKAWLKATVLYKVRTIPGQTDYLIRDFNLTAKPSKLVDITNSLQTNPEVANNGVFLGSIPQAAKSDKWLVNYHQSTDTTFGLSYQEMINETSNYRSTVSGINLKLFQKSGSPVTIFFGEQDSIGNNLPHQLTTRYSFEFDQKAGPNQSLSMFIGNVAYDYTVAPGFHPENWSVRCSYQLKL